MSDVFICQGPNHEGSRLITDPWDRFEARRELRRQRDAHREKTAKELDLCKSCGLAWIAEVRPEKPVTRSLMDLLPDKDERRVG